VPLPGRVLDQDVQPAVPLDRRADEAVGVGRDRDVALDEQGVAAGRAYLLGGLLAQPDPAMPLPMPEAAPVTIATLPSSRPTAAHLVRNRAG
jgi:hypothetical protein